MIDVSALDSMPTASVQTLIAADAAAPRLISWGAHVSPEFKASVLWIEEQLGLNADSLMDCMCFETGGTFSPSIRSKLSSATGLIQFMDATVTAMVLRYPNLGKLATTTRELAKLSAVQQLMWVYYYFKPYADARNGGLGAWSLEDTYMAILLPKMIGQGLDTPMRWSSQAYAANRGLDLNKNGVVTKREATTYVRQRAVEGRKKENLG